MPLYFIGTFTEYPLIASAQKCGGYSFNWTKVELKHDFPGFYPPFLIPFNWTKVELKLGFLLFVLVLELSFNWTKVELKPGGADLSVITGGLLIELR